MATASGWLLLSGELRGPRHPGACSQRATQHASYDVSWLAASRRSSKRLALPGRLLVSPISSHPSAPPLTIALLGSTSSSRRSSWRRNTSPRPSGVSRRPGGQQAAARGGRVGAEASTAPEICSPPRRRPSVSAAWRLRSSETSEFVPLKKSRRGARALARLLRLARSGSAPTPAVGPCYSRSGISI